MFKKFILIEIMILQSVFEMNSSTIRKRSSNPTPVCIGGFSIQTDGTTICNSDSSRNTRQANEIDCVFPFNYNGTWYDTCTDLGQNNYWCSIDSYYQNRKAPCEMQCPLLARMLVQNDPNSVHTSCLPRDQNVISLVPMDIEIANILYLHNSMRSSVIPTATDLKALTWSTGLARIAQSKADSCSFGHDCQGCRTLLNNRTLEIGQNAYANTGGTYDSSFWYNVISAFYTEITNFSYGYGSKTGNWENVGHYTQMISSNSYQIGCGASQCENNLYAYCNFANIQESISNPYTSGSQCSNCNSQMCENNLCTCNKICQNYGTLDPLSCKCNCQPYSTGELCEVLICDQTDKEYGCWGNNQAYCTYENTVQSCPFLCGICSV